MALKGVLVACLILVLSQSTFTQHTIRGTVSTGTERLPYAVVRIIGEDAGTIADEHGVFELSVQSGQHIEISALGYRNDTLLIANNSSKAYNILLRSADITKQEVVISGTMRESSKMESPIPVETYSGRFFQKNASVHLFESMHLVNGVQPQLNCNVCNTGDIHINGLEGPYTMVLIDGMPIVSSLATVYGLMGIPNGMIKRVEVVKGPASTLYGSEAVAGLINVITKSGLESDRFKIDFNGTTHGEFNTDVAAAFRMKKANTLVGVNYYNYLIPRDVNKDNFTDVTLQHRFSVFNKWNFNRKDGKAFSLAVRYFWENRWGGEMQWTKAFSGTDSIYGETITTNRAELFGVYQLPSAKEKFYLDYSYNFHHQNSYYGTVKYQAGQHVAFAQLRYVKDLSWSSWLLGVPFRFTHYDDNSAATALKPDVTFLPGAFVQVELKPVSAFTALLGVRYDYNSRHGSILSPRVAFKISPDKNHVLRLSGGNGYRVVNVFSEDHAALTGAREVVVAAALKPEQSWNANANYAAFVNHSAGFINIDASVFYTFFTNRILADYMTSPDKIIYNNLSGHAVSAGAAINLDLNFTNGLKAQIGATYMENYKSEKDSTGARVRVPVLHAPRFSSTFLLSYTFSAIGLTADLTGRVNGPMYLPVVPNDFRPAQSPWFCIMNIQLTKSFKNGLEIYAGAKNLLNFMPKHPILRPFDPFDKNTAVDNPNGYTFDPSYNYAAVQGIRAYAGLRYTLK